MEEFSGMLASTQADMVQLLRGCSTGALGRWKLLQLSLVAIYSVENAKSAGLVSVLFIRIIIIVLSAAQSDNTLSPYPDHARAALLSMAVFVILLSTPLRTQHCSFTVP